MSYKDVLAFVKENPVCFLATLDGEQPRVRAFLSVLFDDDRIYFTTGATKNVFEQLSRNPRIELCYCSRDFSKMMRITGEIEIVDDRAKKQRLIDERDYLRNFNADDPQFILLRLSHGKARFWTMTNNMKENDLEVIEL